jgi:hypothetical protein
MSADACLRLNAAKTPLATVEDNGSLLWSGFAALM